MRDIESAKPPPGQPTLWRTCRVLANRKRLQILALLIREPNQTVSSVAGHLTLSLPAASQYLRALEARSLLTCRRISQRVEYRLSAATAEGAAGEIVSALRSTLRGKGPSTEPLFKLLTAFTHPRRVEVFRAVNKGADTFPKIRAATHISTRALCRHVAKLEARGFVKADREIWTVATQKNPLGRVLARLAGR